jgi:hypothetical protein
MNNKKVVITSVILALLISSGCSTPPANTQDPNTDSNLKYSVAQESQQVQFIGLPYEIPVDNCNGARDSEKTDERSKSYLTELNLTVSNKVAAEVGGDVEVAKVMLSDEIGIALGIRIGTETQAKSSIKITTPAGQKTVTHVQWKETWTDGTISISRIDGTYVDSLPYSVLNSLTLEQLDSQTIDCQTGSVIDNGSTTQPITPAESQAPSSTKFEVYANLSWQNTGVQIKSGDRLRIIWDGVSKWRGVNSGDFSDPLGGYIDPNSSYACTPLMPSEQAGWNGLVAKIGENGAPTNPFKLTPIGEGLLYLAMNDCDKQRYDNEGSVVLTIEIQR